MEVIGGLDHQQFLFFRVDPKIEKYIGIEHLAAHGVQDHSNTFNVDPNAVAQWNDASSKTLHGIPNNFADDDICIYGIASIRGHLAAKAQAQSCAFTS